MIEKTFAEQVLDRTIDHYVLPEHMKVDLAKACSVYLEHLLENIGSFLLKDKRNECIWKRLRKDRDDFGKLYLGDWDEDWYVDEANK